jgi:hypothetical protein
VFSVVVECAFDMSAEHDHLVRLKFGSLTPSPCVVEVLWVCVALAEVRGGLVDLYV